MSLTVTQTWTCDRCKREEVSTHTTVAPPMNVVAMTWLTVTVDDDDNEPVQRHLCNDCSIDLMEFFRGADVPATEAYEKRIQNLRERLHQPQPWPFPIEESE